MHYDTSVTVVITTRLRVDLLPRAVESVLRQSLPAKEIIVVVDGRDAATEHYLRGIADRRIRTIALQKQAGGCSARNAGVRAATGDWVAFLDDDDEWMPEKLRSQIDVARGCDAQYPVIACRVSAVTPEGRTFLWPKRRMAPGEHLSEYLLARHTWTQGEGLITTSMIMAPRELLLRVPFKAGLKRHQEWDWLLRASASAEVAVVMAWEVLAIWHIEGKRSSVSKMDQWKTSFDWILSMRRLVTPRAYASFLMVFVSAIAAREGDASALRNILREAWRNGRPTRVEYMLMAAMWLLPQTIRRKLRNFVLPQVQTT